MSFSEFVASVRAYYKPRNVRDGVQIKNRLREICESSDQRLLEERPRVPENQYHMSSDSVGATDKPVGANDSSAPE
jgi:hypothetical protein